MLVALVCWRVGFCSACCLPLRLPAHHPAHPFLVAAKFAEKVRLLPNAGIPSIHKQSKQIMEYPDPWVLRHAGKTLGAGQRKTPAGAAATLEGIVDENIDAGHRHFSAMHWLYPSPLHHAVLGSALDAGTSDGLYEAAANFMMHKKRGGGGHTSWSASWEAALWARLGNAVNAYDSIQRIKSRYVTANLLSIHPPLQDKHTQGCITCFGERPFQNANGLQKKTATVLNRRREFETNDNAKFQMDGNSGYTAAVMEMLLHSHAPNALSLLPALPVQWASGRLIGARARGHMAVSVTWSAGKVVAAELQFLSVHPYWTFSAYHKKKVLALAATPQPEDGGFPLALWAPNTLTVQAGNGTCKVEQLTAKTSPGQVLTLLRVDLASPCSIVLCDKVPCALQ